MIIEIDEGKGGMSHLSVRLHSIADKTSAKVYDKLNVSCACVGERGVYDRRIDMKRVWCTEEVRKESVLWF